MAEQRQFSLQTVIHTTIHGVSCEVSVLANTASELRDTVAALTDGTAAPEAAENHNPVQGPAVENPTQPAQQTQAPSQPQMTAQPGPSAAATAPAPDATPSATTTAEQPSQPELTLNDVLGPARQLLQLPNGEDTLRQILGQFGATAISQADPQHYAGIKQAIEQNLGQ